MRSKLFVPASRPELFTKALAGDADALSLDLEDSVAEGAKESARATVASSLASAGFGESRKILVVRVNATSTPHFAADIAAVVHPRLDLLNLPKVESPDEVRAVCAELARIEKARGITRPVPMLVNIESPRGLRLAAEIACADRRVAGLQLGFADLLEPLGIDRSNAAAIRQIQLAVRLAAGEAGVWACDAAYAVIQDIDGFAAEAVAARRLGFIGKTCVHPAQVSPANEIFRPTAAEVAFARRIVEAADKSGSGAFSIDGRMIDAPFIRRARALVSASETTPAAGS